ncbi:glucokinase [Evansella vedderi]|uniref:Glucokinase n=1 Tax=Evansella vedderi TaxID=38282 RepID=A0ABT9ZXB8_9BACI|nr:ROK family protein [Evansella vedderi]MDQ0255877.1 glucokinase [Evansella vedderi]
MEYALGIDIGGTKIAAAILNQSGEIINRVEVKSKPENEEKMFEQVVECIKNLLSNSLIPVADICGMGIGIPGKVDQENGLAVFQNNLPWRNFPIKERLKSIFPVEHIVIDNDVCMAAFAEWKQLDMKENTSFVYITVSTGIACSFINSGSVIRGAGFAGEIGLISVLNNLSESGIETLERSSSGLAIEKLAKKHFQNPNMTTKDFFDEYVKGNLLARRLMKEIVISLTHGIYSIVCLLDPHRIVFGGGVMNHNPFLLDLMKESLRDNLVFGQYQVLDRMQISGLKENSGVIGAGLRGLNLSQTIIK